MTSMIVGHIAVPHDIIVMIHSWLPLIYKVTFSRVCRGAYCGELAETRDIGREVRSRLPFSLLDEAFRCGASITGGFLLDCLYDTNYHTDVDLLFDVGIMAFRQWSLWQHDLVIRDEDDAELKYGKFVRTLMAASQRAGNTGRILMNGPESICHSRKVTVEGIQFDVITCSPGKERYINQYDLDFCKVLWDGETFTTTRSMSLIKKHSVMHRVTSGEIIDYINENEHISPVKLQVGPARSGMRAAKYIDRGFSIEYR